ncbi:MAG TPA: T9SS type A sorting domain-containing protein [Bacteroidia bacterium]|nr:T9SS type A sorting domain-containing protein [Bacteroidia bacterium]HMU19685.1 T9SS type A sorting domain-containing protein [Bacteroidia bacterium]
MSRIKLLFSCFLLICFFAFCNTAFAVTKSTIVSGSWNNPAIWSPVGVPAATDDVVISSAQNITISQHSFCKSLVVSGNAMLSLSASVSLQINGGVSISGTLDMNGGNIKQIQSGALLQLGALGKLIWNPGDNTLAGASLLTNSVESFNETSTIEIKKWYSYATVPLASVVTGNFGNVTISTQVGSTLFEWNQNNQFESHQIKGTLTIINGWVVLDKSGRISDTKIGRIILPNVNSVLEFHSGNHPSSFKVTTDSIANIGGEITGILNGEGNVTLNTKGGFLNMGNVELIYNKGTLNTSNGNAKLNVGGKYMQTHGDLRGVFNLSSTSAGNAELKFNSLEMTGGLLFAYYACNASGALNSVTVTNDLILNLSNASDKFRVNGLTTLAGQYSKSRSLLKVDGNLILSGNAAAEFTSSGSVGAEENRIKGDVNISGLNSNFNMGSHTVILSVNGDVNINGGNTCFSKTPGISQISFNRNFSLQSGTFVLKGHEGMSELILNGAYSQTGGVFYLHSNTLAATNDSVKVYFKSSFRQWNGIINFDDNPVGGKSVLYIQGNEFIAKGSSLITRAGSGTGAAFGTLVFGANGELNYQRSAASVIDQIKQSIAAKCKINITEGNMLLSSHNQPSVDFLRVESAATLNLLSKQIKSNLKYQNSGLTVAAGGTIMTTNAKGFFNTFGTAALCNNGNLNYFLDKNSIIEYAGSNQTITGSGFGDFDKEQHKYGVLRVSGSAILSSNVDIRNRIELGNSTIKLNQKTMTLENGNTNAISATGGYLICTSEADKFLWKNMKGESSYTIPFSTDGKVVSNVVLKPIVSGDISMYNYTASPIADHLPDGIQPLIVDGKDVTNESLANRIIGFDSKVKANITFHVYKNEMADFNKGDSIFLLKNSGQWEATPFSTIGGEQNPISIQATNINANSVFAFCSGMGLKISDNTNGNNNPQGIFKVEQISPVPFSDFLNVNINAPATGLVNLTILGSDGRELRKQQYEVSSGKNLLTLGNLSGLPTGVYFIQINGFKQTITKKIMRQ